MIECACENIQAKRCIIRLSFCNMMGSRPKMSRCYQKAWILYLSEPVPTFRDLSRLVHTWPGLASGCPGRHSRKTSSSWTISVVFYIFLCVSLACVLVWVCMFLCMCVFMCMCLCVLVVCGCVHTFWMHAFVWASSNSIGIHIAFISMYSSCTRFRFDDYINQ